MPLLASLLLVISLVLAMLLGPQMRAWSWGPSLLVLGVAVAAALPMVVRRKGLRPLPLPLLAIGLATVGWFGMRMMGSPVAEAALADGLLLAAAVGAFWVVRGIDGQVQAGRVLAWGLFALCVASSVVVFRQMAVPGYSPLFPVLPTTWPTGFFAHYNEGANFLIGTSLLLGGMALAGGWSRPERIVWGLAALAGLVAVYFMRSRGGISAAAAGLAVFSVLALIHARRLESRWFGIGITALPLIAAGVVAFWLLGWKEAQEVRGHAGAESEAVERLLDNDIRLYMLGMAVTCITENPLQGGGSRSFAWKCYPLWDPKAHGAGGARPDLIHNEIVQAFTDYGLMGGMFLLVCLAGFGLLGLLRLVFDPPRGEESLRAAGWRMGGIAAMAGLVAHSNFSFVFHLLPACLLLGVAMAMAGAASPTSPTSSRAPDQPFSAAMLHGHRAVFLITGVIALMVLAVWGWTGSRVCHILWPAYFSKTIQENARLAALDQAIELWPTSELHIDRAEIHHRRVLENRNRLDEAERALADYAAAERLHRFEPTQVVNRANLLAFLGRDADAEQTYARAIRMQGGMEVAFQARYSHAEALYRRARRGLARGEAPESVLADLEAAALQITTAFENSIPWLRGAEGRTLRIAIFEWLGVVREATGDWDGAMEAYNTASAIPTGAHVHYRAARLMGQIATEREWKNRRPSQALSGFLKAKERLLQAGSTLPEGISAEDRREMVSHLDEMIVFLRGAKIEPAD